LQWSVPEFPDISIYLEALERRILGATLKQLRIENLFLLRTARPPIERVDGRTVTGLRRIGKRIVFGFEGELWLVLHLMIAGRLHWSLPGAKPSARNRVATFEFSSGALVLSEAGTKKRASLHLIEGEAALAALDPGGIDVFAVTRDAFAAVLTNENHTLKRALTDPHFFSGIGNAYSDEILHAAKLSPVLLTKKLTPIEISLLFETTKRVLITWVDLLRKEAGDNFPEKVTAFRPEMAVHGKFGQACPVCGGTVQRIRYADNETNYCPTCQTGGRVLADRSLSRLLKEDWPKTVEAWEERIGRKMG